MAGTQRITPPFKSSRLKFQLFWCEEGPIRATGGAEFASVPVRWGNKRNVNQAVTSQPGPGSAIASQERQEMLMSMVYQKNLEMWTWVINSSTEVPDTQPAQLGLQAY